MARSNYLFRANKKKKKSERQNESIVRTNVKKSCDSTVMNYFKLDEFRKQLKSNQIANLTLDEMVERVCERRIGLGLNKPKVISKYRS